jgi:dephospho-CoA kinase
MLANRSRLELDKLKAIEDGAHQLQAKDRQIGAQIQKNVELRNELNTLKQERTRESSRQEQGSGQKSPRSQTVNCFALFWCIQVFVSELAQVLLLVACPQNSII